MRLICPNCGAQYEVPEDVIPDEGRDVQCSNCGDTWYQASALMLAQAASAEEEPPISMVTADIASDAPGAVRPEDGREDIGSEPDQEEDMDAPVAAPEPVSAAEAETEADPQDAHWPEAPEADVEDDDPEEPWQEDPDAPEAQSAEHDDAFHFDPPGSPAPEAPAKRRLDPDVSRVLREEAMREASLRSGRPEALETQTELGLEDPADDEHSRRARQAQDRMARMRGEPPAPPPQPDPAPRRSLLPDIEDVNHSLAPGQAARHPAGSGDDPSGGTGRSGFSRGFLLVMVLMLLAILVYSNAPAIAERLPQADPYLSSYVGLVDQARLWLDTQAKTLASD